MRKSLLGIAVLPLIGSFCLAQDDLNWDDRFGRPGVGNGNHFSNGSVNDIIVDGADVYVGGDFSVAGTISATGIARWNSTTNVWQALGNGLDDKVGAMILNGDDLYVSIWLSSNNGKLVKWNKVTQTWSDVTDANGWIAALAFHGNDMYACGWFTSIGEVGANRIAKWDGVNWSALGDGLDVRYANTIAVLGNDIYIGGYFEKAGSINAPGIAKWSTTTQTWSALRSGLLHTTAPFGIGICNVILPVGSFVYVGGYFNKVDNLNASNFARWNTTFNSWEIPAVEFVGDVGDIVVDGSDLIIGGYFNSVAGVSANGVVRWNPSSNIVSAFGQGLGTNFDGNSLRGVRTIAKSGSALYAGGDFSQRSSDGIAENIARWDGTSWVGLGNAPGRRVLALATDGDKVLVGGTFKTTGPTEANRIAIWDRGTNTWSKLGDGLNNNVTSVAFKGSEVYAAGSFTQAGGSSANRIAKWDGGNWSPLGAGLDAQVSAIALSGGNLYAVGVFSNAGSTPAKGIAKWDGNAWSALGAGVTGPAPGFFNVNAVAVDGNTVYIGGNFNAVDGVSANNVARWNGSSWSALGSGVNSFVNTIAIEAGKVYVGGSFTTAGGNNAKRIAVWDDATGMWSELGGGANDPVFAIKALNGHLYCAGLFTQVGGVDANRVAKWNIAGNTWSALGSGMDNVVSAIAVSGHDVFFGGEFTTAGGKHSFNFARWSDMTTAVAASDKQPQNFGLRQNYPNPFNPSTTISYRVAAFSNVTLAIYDLLGKEIVTLVRRKQSAGAYQTIWDGRNALGQQAASGVYFYRLQAGEFVQARKMLLIR